MIYFTSPYTSLITNHFKENSIKIQGWSHVWNRTNNSPQTGNKVQCCIEVTMKEKCNTSRGSYNIRFVIVLSWLITQCGPVKCVTRWCMCVFKGILAVNLPVYGLPSRGVLHLVSLTTEHINDCIVAKKVTCKQKRNDSNELLQANCNRRLLSSVFY